MAKARQQYFADEVSLFKEARTITFDENLLNKINDIDTRAEENVIEIVKVNSVPLPVDAQKAVNVSVPLVEDSLNSIDDKKSLSARQWKILYDYILNLQSRGRFLSNWDASNGQPVTAPFGTSYNYNPWDYYVVTILATDPTQNLRPDWPTYTWSASQVFETETLDEADMYIYDWAQWLLQKNTARQIAIDPQLDVTSPRAVENRAIANAINLKQNILHEWNNIHIDPNTNVISADNTTYSNLPAAEGWVDVSLVTTGDKYNWDHKQDKLIAHTNITIDPVTNKISATDTTYPNLPEAENWQADTLVTTGDKYNWNHKQDGITWGDNITIVNNTISADNDAAIWWKITGTLSNQVDLQTALDAKQNKLFPGDNITINPNTNVISATNTTYTAADFDIKDLADSSNLRNLWSDKQDYIADLSTIRAWAAKWMTALQPWQVDNVSELINDAGYITKAVSDLTNYYNKNETYTKTEVDALIANFAWFKVVSVLPATWLTTLIYLLWPSANNTYEEYIYTENQWVKIWETTVDLSNYFHKVNDDSNDIIEWTSHLFMTPAERLQVSKTTNVNSWDETKASIEQKLWAASPTNNGYLSNTDWNTFNNKQNKLLAGVGIVINWDSIATSLVAWNGININWNVITNTKPFDPTNESQSQAWQILRKWWTNTYYWDNENSWVTSVNWRTWAVTVEEFLPRGTWYAWQVLKLNSNWTYSWQNDNTWGWWGGGWTTYYGWDYITIDPNDYINNTAPFLPTPGGSAGQILTKTSNWYKWDDLELPSWSNNVKFWTLNSNTQNPTKQQEIYEWCYADSNNWAVINDTANNDVFIFYKFDSYGTAVFRGTKRISEKRERATGTTSHGWFTKQWQLELDIYPSSLQYRLRVGENPDDDTHTNYLSALWAQYPSAFMPTDAAQPATKKYVDDTVAWAMHGITPWTPVITNNQGWTSYAVSQIWVWTQSDYNNLWQYSDWVIYNIISSS